MNFRHALTSIVSLWIATLPLAAQTQNPDLDRIYDDKTKFSFDFSKSAKGGPYKWKFERQEVVKDQYAILEGDPAVVEYQDVKLSANRITLNIKTNDIEAQGNVILDQGPNRLSADRVVFNLDSKIGTLFNARASFEPSVYFSGAKIEKLNERTFRLTDGVFTSCDIDNPAWSFRVSSGLVTIDDYARLKNLSFRAQKMPLFWTPYIVWPTKRDRSRGFLIPKFGSSSLFGTHAGLSYFIPHGEWADTTLYGDYYSEGYNGIGVDTRYVPSQNTAGRLQAFAITDPDADATGADEIKWRYSYKHTQDSLPGGFRGVIDVTDYSDLEFFRRFEDDFAINTISQIYSSAYLTKNAAGSSLNIRADRREQLTSGGSQVFEQLPSVQYRLYPNRIGTTPFYVSLESSASYLRFDDSGTTDQAGYFRGDLFPTLSLQMRTPLWFSIKPQILARYTYYTQSRDEETRDVADEAIDRTYGQALVDVVGPSFSRIFNRSVGGFEKFKHVVEPRVRYTHSTDVENQESVIRFDTVDSPALPLVDDFVEYALVNRIIAKGKGPSASAREIFSFTIKQAASLSGPFDPNAVMQSDYTPITISARSNPYQNISMDASTSIGNESHDFEQASLSLNLQGSTRYLALRWFATFENSLGTTADSSQIQLRAGSPIIPERLRADLQLSYDAERSDFLEQRYSLGYFGSCWGVRFEYRDLTVPVQSDEYIISLSLRNVGTVFDFKASADLLF